MNDAERYRAHLLGRILQITASGSILCAFYGLVAVAALVATWSQNLAYFASPDSGGMMGFLRATVANHAAASIGIDLAFLGVAACVFMVVESRRLGIRFVGLYILLSCTVAISVFFPLFLIARERALAAGGAARD